MHQVLVGDCRELLRSLPDNSADSCVTDPPYHLVSIVKRFGAENAAPAKANGATGVYQRASKGFMGQTWDGGDTAFQVELWAEVLRVLKPGGHVAAFSGTRTYHRMACAIEDAGFEVRDQLGWAYGSGFPKSHDVSKGIDRAAGGEREIAGKHAAVGARVVGIAGNDGRCDSCGKHRGSQSGNCHCDKRGETITDEAREWEGWGTALKPSWEPICLARKPLSEKSIAANVLKWGTGALNIDGCRIGTESTRRDTGTAAIWNNAGRIEGGSDCGRWPANLCHDGSDEVLAGFPDTDSGGYPPAGGQRSHVNTSGKPNERGEPAFGSSSGSAARFFYCAKASKWDRLGSDHPTVKPVELMRWLDRLITPPGGTILDPFAGTGSTGIAAHLEGFSCTMMELREEAAEDIRRRLAFIQGQGGHSTGEKHKSRLSKEDHASKARGEDLPLFGG